MRWRRFWNDTLFNSFFGIHGSVNRVARRNSVCNRIYSGRIWFEPSVVLCYCDCRKYASGAVHFLFCTKNRLWILFFLSHFSFLHEESLILPILLALSAIFEQESSPILLKFLLFNIPLQETLTFEHFFLLLIRFPAWKNKRLYELLVPLKSSTRNQPVSAYFHAEMHYWHL